MLTDTLNLMQAVYHYLRFFRQHPATVGCLIVLSLFQGGLYFFIPRLIKGFLSASFLNQTLPYIVSGLSTAFGLFLLISLSQFMESRLTVQLVSDYAFQLRRQLLYRIVGFSKRCFDQKRYIELLSPLLRDTEHVERMTYFLLTLFPAVFVLSGLLIMLLTLAPFLVIGLAGLSVMVLSITLYIGHRLKYAVSAYWKTYQIYSQSIHTLLKHLDSVRLYSYSTALQESRDQSIRQLKTSGETQFKWHSYYRITHQLLLNTILLGLFLWASIGLSLGYTHLHDVVLFFVLLLMTRPYLSNLVSSIPKIMEGAQSLNAILNLTDSEPLDFTATKRQASVTVLGNIELKNVSFSYDQQPVLSTISLLISSGQTVGIIGKNGSGKSTLLQLLLGSYPPSSGEIFVEGTRLDLLDISHYHAQVGVVLQSPMLLSGTIRDNFLFFDSRYTQADIELVCEVVGIHETIQSLPNGYDTQVGDTTPLISGGQAQRLAIARALIHRPRLLILDEPSNHLDSEVVNALIRRIQTFLDHPTIVVATHDVAIKAQLDCCYELETNQLTATVLTH